MKKRIKKKLLKRNNWQSYREYRREFNEFCKMCGLMPRNNG